MKRLIQGQEVSGNNENSQTGAGLGDILCRDTSHMGQGLLMRTEEEAGAYVGDRTKGPTDKFGL